MAEGRVPWWLFGVISIGALVATGIYVGIMSVEGTTGGRLAAAAGYGLLGLIMFWGATHRGRGGSPG
jgi:amino acid permease